MKAYTDLNQSKKLAKILPMESADMEYLHLKETNALISSVPFVKDESEVENSAYDAVYERIPCWSFTALFDVLPDGTTVIKDEESDTKNEKYMCVAEAKDDIISTFGNNPVDACYEMVLKLNELNLL